MFSSGTLIITALICLLGGGVLGAVLYRLTESRSQNKTLEERVQKAESELKRYQQDVAEHFAKTSDLVNNLTQSYRDVYEHLANSALKLTTPALSRQILDSANTHLLGTEKTYFEDAQVEAPKDWAPKNGTTGQLSEEYGLDDERDDTAPYHYGDPTTYTDDEHPEEFTRRPSTDTSSRG
ncbi:YhcB family protein [Marinimicrobium sp. ARAG 43.8]|uniref:YhcB family protein n=1 Tax=Marinimicrobium sp. ARAG 43.8 TaxID=3418719 RepID=UPI003CE9D407